MDKRTARSDLFKAGGAAAATAAVGDALLYAAGSAAGAGFAVSMAPGTTTTVGLGQVVGTSVLAVLAGTVGALVLGPRRRWHDVGVVLFTLGSLGGPLSMGVGTATRLSLAAMHVVAASALVVWLRRAVPARRASDGAIREPALA